MKRGLNYRYTKNKILRMTWYKFKNLNKMDNFLEKHNTETKARKI